MVYGCRMNRIKRVSMTGGTVAWGRLTGGKADPGAGHGIVTANAGVMGLIRRADQGVVVTGRAGRAGHGDDTAVNRGIDVHGIPGTGMTAGTGCRTYPDQGSMTFEKRMDRGEV